MPTSKHSKKTKYLVTGGAGAIGSYLVNYLADDKNNLIDVIDNLDSGYRDNLTTASNVNFYYGSITDTKFLNQFSQNNYQYIFHLAACFANQNSVEHPKKDLRVNAEGTLNTLKLALKQPRLRKYLYFSSSCIYGANSDLMKETDDPKPDTPYAISKLAGEQYTTFYHHYHHVPTNIFRLFNIYGSNEKPGRYRNVIPNFVAAALKGEDLTVMGDGTSARDFTFIDNAIEMILGAAWDVNNPGETYNIANGDKTQIIDLANTIIKTTGSKSIIRYVPLRAWDTIPHRQADVSKISKYVTKKPPSLTKGVKQVVNFIKKTQSYE